MKWGQMLSGLPGCCHLHAGDVGNFFLRLLARGFTIIYKDLSSWFRGTSGCSAIACLLSINLDLWCLSVPCGGNPEPDHPILMWRLSDQEVRNPVIQWSCKILQQLEKTYKWSWTCQMQHILKSNLVLIKFILTLEGEEGENHIFYDSSLPQDNKTWSEDIKKNMWLQTSFLPLKLFFSQKSSSHRSTEPCTPLQLCGHHQNFIVRHKAACETRNTLESQSQGCCIPAEELQTHACPSGICSSIAFSLEPFWHPGQTQQHPHLRSSPCPTLLGFFPSPEFLIQDDRCPAVGV